MNLSQLQSEIFESIESTPIAMTSNGVVDDECQEYRSYSPGKRKAASDLLVECGAAVYAEMKASGKEIKRHKWEKASKKMAKRVAKEREQVAEGACGFFFLWIVLQALISWIAWKVFDGLWNRLHEEKQPVTCSIAVVDGDFDE